MKHFFGENSLWAPADYLYLSNGIIRNRAVGIHGSELRPENDIQGRIKSYLIPCLRNPNPHFLIRMNGGMCILE